MINNNRHTNKTNCLRQISNGYLTIAKENISYTFLNTPPPPLYNVPKRGFSS